MPFDAEDRPPSPPSHANRHMTSPGPLNALPRTSIERRAGRPLHHDPPVAIVNGLLDLQRPVGEGCEQLARARTPGRRVPLLAEELPEQKSSHRSPVGDEPAVSPATRRRLVAFQLGSDVVGVVDACSRAKASAAPIVRVVSWTHASQSIVSKRSVISRSSADVSWNAPSRLARRGACSCICD